MATSTSWKKGESPSVCHLCETSPHIQSKCLDCDLSMCQKCRDKIHVKIKNADRHKIVDIKDIGTEREIDFTNLKCDDHSALCCLFCNSCDILICPTCVAKGHKKHDLIEISEGYQQNLDRMKDAKLKTEETLKGLDTVSGNLEQFRSVQENNIAHEEKQMEDHRKALQRAVDIHIDKLISDLRQHGNKVLTNVDIDIQTNKKLEQEVIAEDKELKELINTTESNQFFSSVSKRKTSYDIIVPQTPSMLMSISTFVPKDITLSHVGDLKRDCKKSSERSPLTLQVNKQYQTHGIANMCPCTDGTLWIGCDNDEIVQKVRPDKGKIEVLSSIKTAVYGMARTASNDLLISIKGETRLQQISSLSDKISDTKYDVAPLLATAIHITREGKVLVGGIHDELNRSSVFIMDKDGGHERTFERDNNGRPLFTYPCDITGTSNGFIHVVDNNQISKRGRVLVLSQGGDIRHIYNGHPEVNIGTPFQPTDIATTPRDNVIVLDLDTDSLHILDNTGHLLTLYDTNDAGIEVPYSLAFTSTGSLWIGSTTIEDDETKEAELYHVNISGY